MPESRPKVSANRIVDSTLTFVCIFTFFTLVTTILFWQWIPFLRSALIGPPGDNLQDFWNTWYASGPGLSRNFFSTTLIRFPEGTSLYYHSFAYPKIFAVALLSKFVGADPPSLVLLQNLSLLISFPLAGVGAFYLVRHFTGSVAGALAGGFVFAFNPSHVTHMGGNAHVSSIEFIPFFLLSYLMALERKSMTWLACAITFYALSALSCWYYLFYIGYFIGFHTVYVSIRTRIFPKGWGLLIPTACLAGVIMALSPLLVPMAKLAMSGVSVYASGTDRYVADILGYAAFPPCHFLASSSSPFHLLSSLSERLNRRIDADVNQVYLGLVNVAVLAWACLRAKRKNNALLAYVLCGMAVFCVLASGDSLHVLGHSTFPLPGAVLSKLPFFKNVRVPSRAIVFVYLFLAVGVGHAVALAWRERHRLPARASMAVVGVLMVLDFCPFSLATTRVSCSPGFSVVRDDPERGFGILDLPRGYFEDNFYMFQQAACHGRPIVGGNTARDVVVTLRDRLETRDIQAQRRQLADAKVKYVVINHPACPEEWHFSWLKGLFRWRPKDGQQDQYYKTYPIAYEDRDLTVLRVF